MRSKHFLFAILAVAMFASSCTKKTNKDINYTTLAQDSQVSREMSDDVSSQVNNETKGGNYSSNIEKTDGGIVSWKSEANDSINVTLNTNGGVFPMTLTIDFGAGVTGLDGKVRKGRIIGVFSGRYTDPGSVVTISLDNYYVNGYKVEGTKTITNNGRVGSYLTFTDHDMNGRITKPDGGVITWESTRVNTWVNGESTTGWLGIFDDEYDITGSASGEVSDGTDYEIDITTPLHYSVLCTTGGLQYSVLTSGELSYKLDGDEVATLNYGSGTCDRNVVLTYGGNTYNIVVQ